MDNIYSERAALLALLSTFFDSHLAIDDQEAPGFSHVVCIHFPMGQGAWHIADSDLWMFRHLELIDNDYDGHSTHEKYTRFLEQLRVQVCHNNGVYV